MTDGASGPLHVFDSEQIWTVLDGDVSIHIAGEPALGILGPEAPRSRPSACVVMRWRAG